MPSESHPLQLDEKSANVNDVTNELRNVNIKNPILIDSFYLVIRYSNLTRGSSFWKRSRKIMVNLKHN